MKSLVFKVFNPFATEHRAKNSSKIWHFEGGNVVAQSKLVFYHLRNKSLTHFWRLVTGPPNDLPIVPLSVTRWLQRTV